ncbi:hypothetical protein AMTR_s00075p00044910 [Amborella trichopoda]|uniref:Uncharacterized protein n=1 Tax=Amborella trichopoda TaxID=13333 RepID=W1P3W3_AMBTC|nr:hypothetical protein AMTR_s00075p00044910 [Amborella trichopoda]
MQQVRRGEDSSVRWRWQTGLEREKQVTVVTDVGLERAGGGCWWWLRKEEGVAVPAGCLVVVVEPRRTAVGLLGSGWEGSAARLGNGCGSEVGKELGCGARR